MMCVRGSMADNKEGSGEVTGERKLSVGSGKGEEDRAVLLRQSTYVGGRTRAAIKRLWPGVPCRVNMKAFY